MREAAEMFKEVLRESLIFVGIAFAPAWVYIAFCLLRGVVDDVCKFIRGEGRM